MSANEPRTRRREGDVLSASPHTAGRPLVEVLYFEGCPNQEATVALVERLSREVGLEAELWLVRVSDQAAAERLRCLGSPTVRVGGVDLDPFAGERCAYGLCCRVFQTGAGVSGQPEERRVREALSRELVAAA